MDCRRNPVSYTHLDVYKRQVFAAELFLIKKKSLLFLTDDKEEALYITDELEDLLGKENVLYFPPTHLEPYQICLLYTSRCV